ncbi:MAG TPA: DivIVA domain-containing protein [Actinocatenispora sp.]
MREILLLLVVALVAAGIVFGVAVLLTGGEKGMAPAEPDDRVRRLPGDRPLSERDLAEMRFDTAPRGYRMRQVDVAVSRVAYDLGYKQELIAALEAEVDALREGRAEEADLLRDRRLAAREPGRGPEPTEPSGFDPTAVDPLAADPTAIEPVAIEPADAEPVDAGTVNAGPVGAGAPDAGATDAAPLDGDESADRDAAAPDGVDGPVADDGEHAGDGSADEEQPPGAAGDEPAGDVRTNGRSADGSAGTSGARSAAVARRR